MSLTPRLHRIGRLGTLGLLLLVACGDSPGGADGDGPGGDAGPDEDGGAAEPDANVPPEDDCDPDPPIFPGADEVPGNGWDDDCDGLIDEVEVCATGGDFATIGEALAAATAGDGIEVCAGTYPERLVIDKAIHIRSLDGAAATIVDATGGGRAFLIEGIEGAGVTLEGLTIRNGEAATNGGAIHCADSTFALIDSVVATSEADGGGGLFASGCTVQISGTRFEGNEGDGGGGGALLEDTAGEVTTSVFTLNVGNNGAGLAVYGGTVAITGNEFTANRAGGFIVETGGGWGHGGAIYHSSDAPITGNLIHDNYAGLTGGGVYVFEHGPTLSENTFTENYSENDGGGIYVHYGTTKLIENTFTLNHAGDDGGGVRMFTSDCTMERNVIDNNIADGAGGGARIGHRPCLLVDNLIRDNVANDQGGGLDLDNDSSIVRGGVISGNTTPGSGGGIAMMLAPWAGGALEGVEISNNSAHRGGAIAVEDNYQSLAFRGLLIKGNDANIGGAIHARGGAFSLTQSILTGNHANTKGGAVFFADPKPFPCDADPATSLMPCPPTTTTGNFQFLTVHANTSSSGSAFQIEAAGLTLENSIVSGHTGTAVVVVQPEPAPEPEPEPEPTPLPVVEPPPPPADPTPTWRYNSTTPASFDGMANPTGTDGNASYNPMYVNAAGGDFHLQAGSECIDAGDPAVQDADGTRADLGRYGGPEPL